MTTQHTPGPWSVSPTKHRTIIASAQGFHVAAMDDVSPADAALIAAAPDLLAALQEMLKYAEGFEDADHVIDARAAIARATGEA